MQEGAGASLQKKKREVVAIARNDVFNTKDVRTIPKKKLPAAPDD